MLFIPREPTASGVPKVYPHTLTGQFLEKYEVEQVYHVDEMVVVLEKFCPSVILTLAGTNRSSGVQLKKTEFPRMELFKINTDVLYPAMTKCRMIKTSHELEIMTSANDITVDAHRHVMQRSRPGMTEFQCEALYFQYMRYVAGCTQEAHQPVFASGKNVAFLRHGQGAALKIKKILPGELCLLNTAVSYCGYTADIVTTFPASGKFSPHQAAVYEAVLATQSAVLSCVRPGVTWASLERVAARTLLDALVRIGIVTGTVEDMVEAGIADVFHLMDLGHSVGIDAHDVTDGGLVLEEGMVLAVGPGCLFNDVVLDRALRHPLQSKFLVADVVQKFRSMGGARVQDNVVVTSTGAVNLTKLPRSVDDVEECMKRSRAFRCDSTPIESFLENFKTTAPRHSNFVSVNLV
ncbi:hypothetical protein ANN_07481 [Periplaneta americana]|uniref:Peptidase M24 domain-containing protein n=1 Tax=Periplaneta americana TaxID=6978 RepID=A0ABQ8SYR0_PERAM|nr:hypothetical protein ANN_07481 [Periplaneta americana]